MNKPPKVSICTTFFNAHRYIHRAITSCLNQTYQNIELVIVDDASTDGSAVIINNYAAHDSRVVYFRNDSRLGVSESFLKMAQLATGDLAMVLGADDWIAKDYIEQGVSSFIHYPGIAGVVPDLTTLYEHEDNNLFSFGGRVTFASVTKLHSSEWFVNRIYRQNNFFYVSGYALVRKEDLVQAMAYYSTWYYRNPSHLISEQLRSFFRRALGIDSMLFPEILSRYKNFVFNPRMNYIKIEHKMNQTFFLEETGMANIFHTAFIYLLINTFIIKNRWPHLYRKMKLYAAAEVFSTAIIGFLRGGRLFSFFNIQESKKYILDFCREFSGFEIILAFMYSLLMIMKRSARYVILSLRKKFSPPPPTVCVFTDKNFLDSNRHFTAE